MSAAALLQSNSIKRKAADDPRTERRGKILLQGWEVEYCVIRMTTLQAVVLRS